MKILNKYRFIRGAKGGDAPIPALVPPPSGQDLLKSISIYQGIDALCEGPIYGLVDQFGKKIYGLDMLKGIYLNKVPAMNFAGEYNFRNILMEINLGTENQKPLANFNKVYIYKPANFKLLGKIDPNEQDIRPNGTLLSNPRVERRNFSSWAMGVGWPSQPQDPFVYVHHIRNKDVKKIQVAFVIEQLSDTVSEGEDKGKAGKMGMSKRTRMELMIRYGIEGSKTFSSKRVIIDGLVLSPYSYMVGEETSTVDGAAGSFGNPATLGGSVFNTAATPSVNTSKDSRLLNALSSEEVLRRMMYQEAQ
jgi:hypothetical protein